MPCLCLVASLLRLHTTAMPLSLVDIRSLRSSIGSLRRGWTALLRATGARANRTSSRRWRSCQGISPHRWVCLDDLAACSSPIASWLWLLADHLALLLADHLALPSLTAYPDAYGYAREPSRLRSRDDAVCGAGGLAGVSHPAEQVENTKPYEWCMREMEMWRMERGRES